MGTGNGIRIAAAGLVAFAGSSALALAASSGGLTSGVPGAIPDTAPGEPETLVVGGAAAQPFFVAQLQRRPGPSEPKPEEPEPYIDPLSVEAPPPEAFPSDFLPVPDRWRIVESIGVNEKWWDPYNQNTLKGDRPIWGTQDLFVAASLVSDTVIEPRSTPVPVSIQTGPAGVFGDTDQMLFAQTLIGQLAFIKGDTAFKPQDFEVRLAFAYQYNYVESEEERFLETDPTKGTSRSDDQFGLQEAFIDYHLRNVSDRYDFDSVRVGVQPFSTDFRGFLFQDNQPGIRFFGNRDNNRWQYNLAYFRRLEKDVNSGLVDLDKAPRDDHIFIANLYRQDFPVLGLTSQATIVHNHSDEDSGIRDANGFPARPAEFGLARLRDYDVTYAGLNMDGRLGRFGITASAYYAFGENRDAPVSGEESDIRAFFLAAEPSIDFDWIRLRLSALYASGDDDPFDGEENGFDAIFENPIFAGADTSYWIRQQVPFIGGGFVGLNGRNGLLPNLRHSKEMGSSNFTNPGLTLLGGGADLDITPELRLSFNANYLRFNDTSSLEALRVQGNIDNNIGWDLSTAAIWRPFLNQNVILRLSGAMLLPGDGFKDLYGAEDSDDYYYSVLGNIVLTY